MKSNTIFSELLRTENIVKQYANHRALDNVSITVPEQSIYGLLGPNGAGKTSLIRIINQITGPDSGAVFFQGERLQPRHCELIGYLPEERGLYKKMKVGEQALYLSQLKGLSSKEALKKLKEWFEIFEIMPWWNRKVEELSKGMQQKVQFIITVLHNPKLLIFDEPFSGFDPINANIIKEEILKLRTNGATIIFSTHNMASVEELCDNIALINQSRKILEGSVSDIRKTNKSNIFLVDFVGDATKLNQPGNDIYEVLELSQNKELYTAKIKNRKPSPNPLLMELTKYVEVHSFKEIIPSMNDIFIQTVQNDTNFKTANHE